MNIVGLTGGIGSGKSTAAKFFFQKGIPIYDSDFHAKRLMNQDWNLINKIKELFSKEAYKKGSLDKTYLSKQIFSNLESLKKINNLVHPYVSEDFQKWIKKQSASYLIKESAILFESGFYKDCKWVISVIAPIEKKIERLLKRGFLKKEEILNRMKNQISDRESIKKSQFLIFNTKGLDKLEKEVQFIHNKIMSKLKK